MRLLIIAFLFISINSCSQNVSTLPVNDFEKNLDTAKVQLLDVRKPEEYKSGHLHGAFLADWLDKKQFEERVQYLDKTKPVYLYCLSGGRSAAAANWLAENGFNNVVNMQGGITAWKKEGKPVEAVSNTVQMTGAEYAELIQSSILVLVDFGAEWCIPCKKMAPVIADLEKENTKIKFIKIDAGIQDELVKKYNVEGLPVFILYKNGQEVWRQEGVADKKEFEKSYKEIQLITLTTSRLNPYLNRF